MRERVFPKCRLCEIEQSQSESVTCSVMSDSLRPHGLCSPQGSSVHGILRERILEWVAIPFSKGFSCPRDQTQFSCIARRFFTIWTTREGNNQLSGSWNGKVSWAPMDSTEYPALAWGNCFSLGWSVNFFLPKWWRAEVSEGLEDEQLEIELVGMSKITIEWNNLGIKEITTQGLGRYSWDLYTKIVRVVLRWRRNRTGRLLSPPQIHWKKI